MPEKTIDDIARDVVYRLDTYARDTDEYAFGLPLFADDHQGIMLEIVKEGIMEYVKTLNNK